VSVH